MPDAGLTDNVSYYTSSFHDTYVRQQVVTTCTSGTRPTGVEGRLIFETDTDRFMFYDGSTWKPAVPGRGTFSGTTDGTTSALDVTHGLGWTPAVVIVQPKSPNGATPATRFVSANVTGISSTAFTIGRCVAQDGSLMTSTAVEGYWIAVV